MLNIAPTFPRSTRERRFMPPDLIRHLDRLADFELQHGHSATAERLARMAAELREAAQ